MPPMGITCALEVAESADRKRVLPLEVDVLGASPLEIRLLVGRHT